MCAPLKPAISNGCNSHPATSRFSRLQSERRRRSGDKSCRTKLARPFATLGLHVEFNRCQRASCARGCHPWRNRVSCRSKDDYDCDDRLRFSQSTAGLKDRTDEKFLAARTFARSASVVADRGNQHAGIEHHRVGSSAGPVVAKSRFGAAFGSKSGSHFQTTAGSISDFGHLQTDRISCTPPASGIAQLCDRSATCVDMASGTFEECFPSLRIKNRRPVGRRISSLRYVFPPRFFKLIRA